MITRYRLFVTVTIEGEEPPEVDHVIDRVQETLSSSEKDGGAGLQCTVVGVEKESTIDPYACPSCHEGTLRPPVLDNGLWICDECSWAVERSAPPPRLRR